MAAERGQQLYKFIATEESFLHQIRTGLEHHHYGGCSLHSKRFRVASEQRRRNESQRQRRVSCAAKTENPVPLSFFALKPNENACYAG